nr:SDR family NAD(P)-dependent oxidoreductase [Rhodococcus qingshengii]
MITGAGGDIGCAVARRMATPATRILLVDIDGEKLKSVHHDLVGRCHDVATICADVSSEADALRYSELANDFGNGKVDLLLNNAGIAGSVSPVTEYPVDVFDSVLAVNVRAIFLGLKHIGSLMGHGGAVVNTSSIGGLVGQANLSAYVASKHAVIGLTKSVALEWASRGIRVNAVCPGPVAGEMINGLFSGLRLDPEQRAAQIPLGRLARPADVAESVAFLLSSASEYVTGTSISVDGGRLAN